MTQKATGNMELHWPRCASPLNLNADEVHVWAILLDVAEASLKRFAELLSAYERERAERFHFEHVRRRFIASHGALRQLVGRYLGIEPADVAFTSDDGGKPRIVCADKSDKTCNLHFNLSHSGGLALAAIASGVEVGVDVEQVRAVSNIERLARRYFHAEEADEVLAAEGDQRDLLFMRCWTAKEAVVKAYGSGIGAGLNRFRVPLNTTFTGWVDLSALPQPFTDSRCWVTRIVPCDGYAAAQAFLEAEPRTSHFTFTM
jgi:4'-phosphopantetheinyl transferase